VLAEVGQDCDAQVARDRPLLAGQLPPRPSGKYGRTMAPALHARGKTAGRASTALERGEELVAHHAAHLVARVPKRSPSRRAR
jgi:hypothetical protein